MLLFFWFVVCAFYTVVNHPTSERPILQSPGPRKSDPSLQSSGPCNQKPTNEENSNAVIPICFRTILYRIQRPRPTPPNATSDFLYLFQFPIQLYTNIFGFTTFNSHFTSSPTSQITAYLTPPIHKSLLRGSVDSTPPQCFFFTLSTYISPPTTLESFKNPIKMLSRFQFIPSK